ncbi:unnamed protein product [Prorocentrum cordatum]|uniref:Ion transport domain-containing protein n=1 Tax=Prorocentrum cordatum TaxID=2364126 RepID=A0ABN9PGZ7_9DINO|nr:unnamed protein product [Polarella glacialis]
MADNNAGGSPIRFRRRAPARRTCKGFSRLSLSGPDADTSALRQRMEAQMGLMEDALRQLKEDVGTMGLLADRPDATGRGDEPSQGDGVAREARAAEPGDDSECAVASDADSSEVWDACEWPQTVAMRPCFEEALAELDIGNSRATTTKDFLQRARFRIKTRENDLVTKQHFTSRFILYPHCRRVLIFKAFSIVVLVFDLCMVPYMIAWDSPYEGWTFAHMLFSALFWFLDMISNFMIGYVRDYQVQMRPMDIVVHYVRTRFLLDLLFVCSDVVSLVVLGGAGAADAYWLFSALRALKAGRLMQIRNLLNACSQIITDEKYHT